jgi:eukaryotic-like serine/threonine-protein kinase
VACPACGKAFFEQTNFCPNDGTPLSRPDSDVAHLIPNFELGSEIGCGGMGVVYKARHCVLDKWFAVKMLPLDHLDRVGVLRFQQEARAAGSLQHENVVAVHDCGVTSSGRPYMVMEYAPGETLAELLKRRGHLSVGEALPIFAQICAGIHHAHTHGILHRDLKPSNVVLVDKGNSLKAKILDFGIAKIMDGEVRLEKGLTQTGEVFGSPPYMSPEQALGKSSDRRTDIYSLGCLMYEVLTGAPPIVGHSVIETIYRQIHEIPSSLKEGSLGQEFSQELENIIAKTLAKDMDRRFPTVGHLQRALSELESTHSSHSISQTVIKARSKFLVPWYCAAIGACILLTVAALPLLQRGSNESKGSSGVVAGIATADGRAGATPARKLDREELEALGPLDILPASVDDIAEQSISRNVHETSFSFSRSRLSNRGLLAFLHRDDVTVLRIASTHVDDGGIKSITHLPLTALDLSRTGVTDVGVKRISSISTLRELHLEGLNMTDSGLSALINLRQLSDLYIGSNSGLSDRSWLTLSKMRSLSVLDLSGNKKMSEDGLAQIRSLPLLKKLILRYMNITDKSIDLIRHCSHLTSLDVSGTQIGDAFVAGLDPLQLDHLYLVSVHISDKALRNLPNQKHLDTLMLRGSRQVITDEGMQLMPKLPALKVLYLEKQKNITDRALTYIGQCRGLQELSFRGTQITDAGLKNLEQLPHLSKLDLGYTAVSDAGISSIIKHDLFELNLSGTAITDHGFVRLARMKNLRHLFVSFNPAISPAAFAQLSRQLPSCQVHIHTGGYTDAEQLGTPAARVGQR